MESRIEKIAFKYTVVINIVLFLFYIYATWMVSTEDIEGIYTQILAFIGAIVLGTLCFGLWPIAGIALIIMVKYGLLFWSLAAIAQALDNNLSGFNGTDLEWVMLIGALLSSLWHWFIAIKYKVEFIWNIA